MFHFLTALDERRLPSVTRARLQPAGHVVIATFGPARRSRLPVVRYTHHEPTAEFPGYRLLSASGEDHETPRGTTQQFTAVLLQREV